MKLRWMGLFLAAASAMAVRHEWGEKIKQSAMLLQHGDYKRALSIDERLIGDMRWRSTSAEP